MKEMCNGFICDNGNSAGQPQTPAAADGCAACVTAKAGVAQAYVPSQPYAQPMEQEQGFVCGTVFQELVLPYCAGWHLYQYAKEA